MQCPTCWVNVSGFIGDECDCSDSPSPPVVDGVTVDGVLVTHEGAIVTHTE